MSDRSFELRQFLRNSGLNNTLQTFEKELQEKIKSAPKFDSTFHNPPETANFHQNSFANKNLENKFSTEPTNHNRIFNDEMTFESPYANKFSTNGNENRMIYGTASNDQKSITIQRWEGDNKTNEENFSFGEEASDNELGKGGFSPANNRGEKSDDNNIRSDNFIRINNDSIFGRSGNPRANRMPTSFTGNNTDSKARLVPNRTQRSPNQLRYGDHLGDGDDRPAYLRPRSIKSRNESSEKESSALFFNMDKLSTFESNISLCYSDPCNLTSH